jgi:hypothetical protein
MKIKKALPQLAQELESGFRKIGQVDLAATVSELDIVERCRCGDEGCGTFYTLEKCVWSGKKLEQIVPVVEGLYAVDVFSNKVACIEILDRKDVEDKLNELFPLNT